MNLLKQTKYTEYSLNNHCIPINKEDKKWLCILRQHLSNNVDLRF